MFDPCNTLVATGEFDHRDWESSGFRHVLKEGVELQGSVTQPRRIGFATRTKVDADHTCDAVTRRSSTSYIVYLSDSST